MVSMFKRLNNETECRTQWVKLAADQKELKTDKENQKCQNKIFSLKIKTQRVKNGKYEKSIII